MSEYRDNRQHGEGTDRVNEEVTSKVLHYKKGPEGLKAMEASQESWREHLAEADKKRQRAWRLLMQRYPSWPYIPMRYRVA